ncbi:hypothetical protein OSB04_031188, partial [Centaurea solstitialis]
MSKERKIRKRKLNCYSEYGSANSGLQMASDASESIGQKPKIQIYSTPNNEVTPFWKEKYERDAKKYWDVFYKRHQDRFFKDRHYLDKEWGHYFSVSSKIYNPFHCKKADYLCYFRKKGGKGFFRVGCSWKHHFPLAATYPGIFIHACDFRPGGFTWFKEFALTNPLGFYNKFFKDRHYLDKEWGHYFSVSSKYLLSSNLKFNDTFTKISAFPGCKKADYLLLFQEAEGKVVLEVGCGAGNTIFPLAATYPGIFIHACDFSPRAVDLVKAHKDFEEARINAFACDLTSDDLIKHIPPSSVDVVTMGSNICLIAVSPEKMPLALQNIRKIMKPNAYVLFRDYATGDLAQERLTCKDQKLSENFFVRGDGTRAFYFSEEFLTSLFQQNGFSTEECGVCCKQVENRSREIVMN